MTLLRLFRFCFRLAAMLRCHARETEQCVLATIRAPWREILLDRALPAAPATTLRNFTQAAANNSNPDQVIFSRSPKSQHGQWDP
jgi:hypothetical protein